MAGLRRQMRPWDDVALGRDLDMLFPWQQLDGERDQTITSSGLAGRVSTFGDFAEKR
ncbi:MULTISPECIES: hypothetical protein [Frankia]|uniref:hypothetical protein n=1 Tax=Frankia TaxID=1854 RepID=UPI000AB35EC4|nr:MULTISPECIES: hypothetical protein [Frankia]